MKSTSNDTSEALLFRLCHVCFKVNKSDQEIQRCAHCGKHFLANRYFEKIHHLKDPNWKTHFSTIDELQEEDLIKGVFVVW